MCFQNGSLTHASERTWLAFGKIRAHVIVKTWATSSESVFFLCSTFVSSLYQSSNSFKMFLERGAGAPS